MNYRNIPYALKFKMYAALMIAFTLCSIQVCAQEVQVNMDSEGAIYEVDTDLNKKLQLFKNHPGFTGAMLMMSNDSTYVMEISTLSYGKVNRIRQPMSKAEVDVFRAQMSSLVHTKAPKSTLDHSGLSILLAGAAGASLGYYGWVTPTVLDLGQYDYRFSIAAYMLTAGAGIAAPIILTRKHRVTPGMGIMGMYGQTRGIGLGLLASGMVTEFDRNDVRAELTTGMVTSLALGVGGFMWADQLDMSAGRASAIGRFGDFGAGIGIGALSAATDEMGGVREIFGSVLTGSVVGIGIGTLVTQRQQFTYGDAMTLGSTGTLGAYIPLALGLAASIEDNRQLMSLGVCLGSVGGLIYGSSIAGSHNYTFGQAVLMKIGMVSGTLVGLGTGYLISEEIELAMITSVIGGIGGFALMSRFCNRRPAENDSKATGLNFDINPLGLMSMAGKDIGLMNGKSPAQALNASFTF